MAKPLSGTNDTSHLSDTGRDRGCPCGRSHPPQGKGREQRPRTPAFDGVTTRSVYQALVDGKATVEGTFSTVHYAGGCHRPIRIPQDTFGHKHVTWEVRCRKCPDCLLAKRRYWTAAAAHQTHLAAANGCRTWFGTLTYRPEEQTRLCFEAQADFMATATGSEVPDWWSDPTCDERFSFVRSQVIADLQRYWKRLRKAGHKFKYFVAIERHKSGYPHIHWLLHETEAPIRKRDLQAHWPFGHTKIILVGGKSKNSGTPERAAFYVAKYLQKSIQARQIASRLYRPSRRSEAKQPSSTGEGKRT